MTAQITRVGPAFISARADRDVANRTVHPASVVLPSSPEANAAAIPAPVIPTGPAALPGFFSNAGDRLWSHTAGTVGYFELAGFRFPIAAYKAALPAVGPDGKVVRDASGNAVALGVMRGGRIGPSDIAWLASQHFKGVLSLLAEGDDREQQLVRAAGMKAERIHIIDNHAPSVADVKRALDFMTANAPVYVHCEAGIGRTGTIIAAYRIAVEGCTVQQALTEADHFGHILPWQRDFIIDLPRQLAAGALPGYQLHGNAAREYAALHPTAWNAIRPGLSVDRDAVESFGEIRASPSLITAPMRPFSITAPAVRRTLSVRKRPPVSLSSEE